jgi:hypothetical protein
MGHNYTVLSGLKPGETVVTEGSFFLRAEILRNAQGVDKVWRRSEDRQESDQRYPRTNRSPQEHEYQKGH